MKSNKKLGFILAGIIIIFLVAAGFLYVTNSREVSRYDELNDAITKNQTIISRSVAEKKAKETEALDLEKQLADVQQTLEQTGFRASAESIEYDRILFSIANSNRLQITNLNATAPLDMQEGDITYQVTTFTVSMEGLIPTTIFSTSQDSVNYISSTVDYILAYVNTVATSADFDTTQIQSVNISAPEPMTDLEVKQLIEDINGLVESKLTKEETEGLTEDQKAALVQSKLAAMPSDKIQQLMEEAGFDKITAVVIIKIWTCKGA
jgi:hypothetical protein